MPIKSPKQSSRQEVRRGSGPRVTAKVRPASFDDYDQIAALHIRNGLTATLRDEWIAAWSANPAYEEGWPIGWVLENGDAQIVGSIGNIPMNYWFQGRRLRVAVPSGWAVDPSYRGHSLLMLDRQMKQKDVDLLIASTVSPAAEPAYRVLNWVRVPSGDWDQSEYCITSYRRCARSALMDKAVPLANSLSYPVAAVLFCRDAITRRRRRPETSGFEVKLCPEFDERFDRFWEELKRERAGTLLAVRTRDTLAWHYRSAFARRKAWLVAASEGSRLVAYAVFDRQDVQVYQLKRLRVVDCQVLRGAEEAVRGILTWALHECRREEFDLVEDLGCWLKRWPSAQELFPHRRMLRSWTHYYRASDSALAELLEDPSAWAPSYFDGDASL